MEVRSRSTGLSMRERLFCEHYVTAGPLARPIKSAAFAGYKAPQISGNQLLRRPAVQAYIDNLRIETRLRNNITVDDIINELMKIAFADIRLLYNEDGSMKPIHELDADIAATIKDVESREERDKDTGEIIETTIRKVTRADKLNALSQLRDMLGFKQREIMVRKDAQGNVLETLEKVGDDPHKVIFEDNSGDNDSKPLVNGDM